MKLVASLFALASAQDPPADLFAGQPSDACGQSLSGSGSVVSPNWYAASTYFPDNNCNYELTAEPGMHLKVTITHLDTQGTPGDCQNDFLTVDGNTYCGGFAIYPGDPEEIIIASGSTTVNWISDSDVNKMGFRFDFESVQPAGCSETLVGSGVVESPNFPENHPGGLNCGYTLRADPGKKIRIRFTDFDVQPGEPMVGLCGYDFVQIGGQYYCGDSTYPAYPPEEIILDEELIMVQFYADDYEHFGGFRFEFDSYDPDESANEVTMAGDSFWNHFSEFYQLTKEQMESGDRPWKTPHFTWMYNRIMNEDPVSYSQLSGDCTWAIETGNPHPTYEAVDIEYFDASVDRCVNLMAMADMGLSYVESFACMTGHPKPRGTLRRWKMWMNGIRELGEFFCSP